MENENAEGNSAENEKPILEEIIGVKVINSKPEVELLEARIGALKGVEKVRASMVESKVFVAFAPEQISFGEIKAEIESAGFAAESIQDSEESQSSEVQAPEEIQDLESGQDSEAAEPEEQAAGDDDSGLENIKLAVNDMVCESCEKIIEKSLHGLNGVKTARASYSQGTVKVAFNPEKVSQNEIINKIKKAGYSVKASSGKNNEKSRTLESAGSPGIRGEYIIMGLVAIALLLFAYLMITTAFGNLNLSIPTLDAKTSTILIFVVGLLTGFHCIGMCGSFVLSYTAKARQENSKSLNISLHGQYALGKMISYSIIGGIFGLIGSIFVFTPELRAGIALFAGAFLILFGLKMLNVFPILRKFSLPQGMFDKLKVGPLKSKDNSPMIVGLLNGLFIACGPLQAMYILAATTGNFASGAILLFAFAVGTLIPMLGFGVFASVITHGLQNKIVRFSGVVVLIMGLLMINNGLALTGNAVNASTITGLFAAGTSNAGKSNSLIFPADSNYQIINMDVTGAGWAPNSFVLKKGVPVKWVINGKELNGCNSGIRVPAYNLSFSIKPGLQTIEFTPDKEGIIQWSCWMGMIQGTFVVRDDVGVDASGKIVLAAKVQQEAAAQVAATPKPAGGCGCGGGGSTGSCH